MLLHSRLTINDGSVLCMSRAKRKDFEGFHHEKMVKAGGDI